MTSTRTPAPPATFLHAAELLEDVAEGVFAANTIESRWAPGSEQEALYHADLLETAAQLRVMAKPGRRPGPA